LAIRFRPGPPGAGRRSSGGKSIARSATSDKGPGGFRGRQSGVPGGLPGEGGFFLSGEGAGSRGPPAVCYCPFFSLLLGGRGEQAEGKKTGKKNPGGPPSQSPRAGLGGDRGARGGGGKEAKKGGGARLGPDFSQTPRHRTGPREGGGRFKGGIATTPGPQGGGAGWAGVVDRDWESKPAPRLDLREGRRHKAGRGSGAGPMRFGTGGGALFIRYSKGPATKRKTGPPQGGGGRHRRKSRGKKFAGGGGGKSGGPLYGFFHSTGPADFDRKPKKQSAKAKVSGRGGAS